MKKQRWIIILGIMVLVLAAIGPMASAAPKELAPAGGGDFFDPPGQSCLDVVVCPDGIGGSCSCDGSPGQILLADPFSGS